MMDRVVRQVLLAFAALLLAAPRVWAEVPKVAPLTSDAWYWRWLVMLGAAGVICLICFKNPKRTHDN